MIAGPKLSSREERDIEIGWDIAKEVARLDIGQTIIIKTGTIVAVEALEGTNEAIKRGGYGAEVAALVAEEAFDDLDAPPKRLAGLETPIPYAQHLEKSVVPQVEDIVRAAKELVA